MYSLQTTLNICLREAIDGMLLIQKIFSQLFQVDNKKYPCSNFGNDKRATYIFDVRHQKLVVMQTLGFI